MTIVDSGTGLSHPRTLEYMDVPHSLFKCNFSAGTIIVYVKYSTALSLEPGKDFWLFCHLVRCYAVHLGSIENINKRSSGAPASYYFCQNEILYRKRLNGLLSKFLYIYRHLFFVFTVRQKIFTPCNSKTLYIMFTDSRQESLEPKVRDEISFLLGVKKVFFNWFE